MKKVFNFGCLALILFLVSCGKDPKIENDLKGLPHGNFALRLGTMGNFEIVSKSSEEVNVADFCVRIAGKTLKGTDFDTTWTRYADMAAVVTIPAGTYKIEAFNGNQKSGFGTPYYYGKKDFTVGIQELTDAQVTCQLACVKLTVEFTSLFLNNVSDATCLIHQTEGVSLEFDPDKNEGAGYIATPADSTLAITVRGKYTEDGSSFDRTYFIKSVASKQWHKIALSVNTSAGIENGGGMIQIDHSVNEKESTVLVPGSDDLIGNNGDTGSWDDEEEPGEPENPGGNEPGGDDEKPTVEGIGFDIANQMTASASDEKVKIDINILAKNQIDSLVVKIESESLTDDILGAVGLTTSFDIANIEPGSNMEASLAELKLIDIHDPIKGKTSHVFSVGQFMGMLGVFPTALNNTHKFHIRVVDKQKKVTTKVLVVYLVP